MLEEYKAFFSENFTIFYSEKNDVAQNISTTLENAMSFCENYFSLDTKLGRIRVVLVDTRSEFDRLVKDLLEVPIESPSHPARIAQTQHLDMVALSPSAYEQHSTFTYEPEGFKRLLLHELIHIIEEYLNPNIESIPNWWSEGLAIFLSNQWRYDDIFRIPALKGIIQNQIPTFEQIQNDRSLSYDWGWTMVNFIEDNYGQKMINKIVRNCADGNVLNFSGTTIHAFEQNWMQWLAKPSNFPP